MTKTCTKCNEEKSVDNFTKRKLSADGLDMWCRQCKALYEKSKQFKPLYSGNKVCTKCKKDLSRTMFYKDHRKSDGLESRCQVCCKSRSRNKEISMRYGLVETDYEEMLKKQQNKCAICYTSAPGSLRLNRFSIDHCHKTSVVRGLLCVNCNYGLGHFKDNIEILENAVKYLNQTFKNMLESSNDQ